MTAGKMLNMASANPSSLLCKVPMIVGTHEKLQETRIRDAAIKQDDNKGNGVKV